MDKVIEGFKLNSRISSESTAQITLDLCSSTDKSVLAASCCSQMKYCVALSYMLTVAEIVFFNMLLQLALHLHNFATFMYIELFYSKCWSGLSKQEYKY